MVSEDKDYLALEDMLVERVKAELPALRSVMTAMDLSGVQEARQFDSAAHVIYLGDQVAEGHQAQGGTGGVQVVAQLWMIVLAVKFAGTPTTGKGNRRIAGPLISRLLTALCGWQPPDRRFAKLHRINAPKVGYANGFAYYPFAFKTNLVTLGKP